MNNLMTLSSRHRFSSLGQFLFLAATCVGILSLMLMLYNVADEALGLVAIQPGIDPALISPRPLDQLSNEELIELIKKNLTKNAFRREDGEQPFASRLRADLNKFVREQVLEEAIVQTWSLSDSLLRRAQIQTDAARDYPNARLEFRSWVSADFLTRPMSSDVATSGIRTAIFGSLFVITLTILIAFPIGVGAAIYLEEYANRSRLNRIIQTNIDNLAGVPSIVYGMLGLAIFVRMLAPLTSGAIFGVADSNGRTLLSASATMALLILPIIIINAQEAIRAVPNTLRQASYGLGATKWQTIWHHVLPNALPGILTGTILAISRAISETAPLIVIGASTFIAFDPDSLFAKFTVLPIQIYNYVQQPQDEYRHLAAAAIIVLLGLLLSLNAAAIMLRNRFSAK